MEKIHYLISKHTYPLQKQTAGGDNQEPDLETPVRRIQEAMTLVAFLSHEKIISYTMVAFFHALFLPCLRISVHFKRVKSSLYDFINMGHFPHVGLGERVPSATSQGC